MKSLEDNEYTVAVKGVETYTKGAKEFVVLAVELNGLEEIRAGLKLVSSNPRQQTHLTLGERSLI